jgi:hypothetical protein
LTVTVTSDNPDARITLPSLWTFLVNVPLCDFDGDGCGTSDIDALVTEIVAGAHDTMFDVNGDTLVDQADLTVWLELAGAQNLPSAAPYLVGDADLNGIVDGEDFIVWNDNTFTATGLWTLADFNADGVTDGQDFDGWNNNEFTSVDSVKARVVPEPAAWVLLVLATIAYLGLKRRTCD